MRRLSVGTVMAALLLAVHGGAFAAEPQPIPPERFGPLHAMVQAQPGENRFWEVSWLTDLWEARRQAAGEGKPIFIWAGSQGPPITGC
ncbi:MAG: hypothetical protein WED34_21545 [Planctomycetales bacterium]